MESFFIKVFIRKDENNRAFCDSLTANLNAENFHTKKSSSGFIIIDDLVEMIATETTDFYEVVFIGCFSCFSAACNLINHLTNTLFLHYDVLSVKIMGNEIDLSVRDFTGIFYEEYEEKHQWFRANITDKAFNASPSTFYERLRCMKFWGGIGNMLKGMK